MTTTRLIELLQEQVNMFGDLPIFFSGHGSPLEVEKVCDPFPDTETGPYYMGGVILVRTDEMPA